MSTAAGSGPRPTRSLTITSGSHRAPARAMLKAVGFTDDDLRKPLVGIANTWIEIGPCNLHLRRLAVAVKDGVRAAGGDADGVQHRLGLRRHHHGDRRHADVARQPRGDCGLDRARRARQPLRRARRSSSAATRRFPAPRWRSRGSTSRARALRRIDRARQVAGQGRHDSGRVRGGRRVRRRPHQRSRSSRRSRTSRARAPARAAGSSRPTRWRRRASSSACRRSAARPSRRWTPTRTPWPVQAGELVVELARARLCGRDRFSRARASKTPSPRSRRPAAPPTPCCT